ncbi:MAG: VOC family protein [Actinobacteria bacterium]|uniref:VOC family protein n=1 Tax=Candidatus Fonsibacter lacus TaxID=2576439 RepID=A0A965GCY9_9PROT|nr:VOC family protein [Candidatus Fonsibacter lacus]
MHLDHISYVASHDHLIDEVQRIGSRLGAGFMDGGIHPRFGTRNFTLPLQGGRYFEIVCPLDHPAADASAFGKVVSQRAQDGGGLLTWVLSVNDISTFEKRLGRESVDGNRRRPDGSDLNWKQVGVLGTLEDRQLPFFIEWLTDDHPSKEAKAVAKIEKLEIAGDPERVREWIGEDFESAFALIKSELKPAALAQG